MQAAPHPHQAVIDPTGRYIVTPDLGADLIRVFQISNSSNDLLEREPLKVKPGSGPRHAVFWTHTAHTASNHVQRHQGPNGVSRHIYLYVITELANTLTGYRVDYPDNGGLTFTEVSTTTTFGNSPVPDGAAAAEIALVVSLSESLGS